MILEVRIVKELRVLFSQVRILMDFGEMWSNRVVDGRDFEARLDLSQPMLAWIVN
jgi:hypothetical protein